MAPLEEQLVIHRDLADLGAQALDLLVPLVGGAALQRRLAAAVTPSSRARLSSGSPRNGRRIASVFRRAENRPGSRPPSGSGGAAARASDCLFPLRLAMATS